MRNTTDHQEMTIELERQKIALKARSVLLLFSLPLFLYGCGEIRAQMLAEKK